MFSFFRRSHLFRFYAGRWRYADPLAVWRALKSDAGFSFTEDPKLVDAGDEEAAGRMIAAGRRALNLAPVNENGRGVDDATVLSILLQFYEFLAAQKKNTSPTLTSPQRTELVCSEGSIGRRSSA